MYDAIILMQNCSLASYESVLNGNIYGRGTLIEHRVNSSSELRTADGLYDSSIGNVAAGAISQLVSSLTYPLQVSNLSPTSGGIRLPNVG